jgi:hypothetical protein
VRYLTVGELTRPISDEAAETWPAAVERAQRQAAADGLPPVVWMLTDRGVTGALSIRNEWPATIGDEGEPSEPEFGTIVRVSTDVDEIASAAAAGRPPEAARSDAEIRQLVGSLKAERPDLDWDNLLSGALAGPAGPDRPDLPVWEYPNIARDNPDVQLRDLTAVRFPVRYFEGPSSVTSIDEELRPLPSSYKGTAPKPRYIITAEAIIRRYAAMHEAGLIVWDPNERGIVYVKPLGAQRKVLAQWIHTLQPND